MLSDVIRALRLIPRRRHWQWAALVPLALGAALVEGAGAGGALALGVIVAEPDRAWTLPGVSLIAAWVPPGDTQRLVAVVAGVVTVFYVFRAVFLTAFTWVQQSVVQRTASDVADRLFGAYLDAPYAFHLRRNSAGLIQTLGLSVDAVLSLGLGAIVNVVTEGVTLVGLLAVLVVAAPLATMMSIAVGGLMLVFLLLTTRRTARYLGAEMKLLHQWQMRNVQQSLAAFKEVRVMGVGRHFRSAFVAHRRRLGRLRALEGALSTGLRVFVETAFVVTLLLALVVVTLGGVGGGGLIGVMALYAYAGFRIVPSANRLMLNVNVFQGARAHLDGLAGDLDLLDGNWRTGEETDDAPPLPFADRLEFDDVSYRYDEERPVALDRVSLTVRRGESVGIVGWTGSGKSTLIDVLLGLLSPTSGAVRVDGTEIAGNVRGWQHRVGYVPQAFALLDDTLQRNIAFGQPDDRVDGERLQSALRLAHLDDVVAALPAGVDTIVGERGTRLSGGERQRVAIARALYRDPDVLVFDEATSALDNQTERAIISAVDELRGVKTMVVVAHRLSTVRSCDRIVLMQQGRVLDQGRYDELLVRSSAFRTLASEGA